MTQFTGFPEYIETEDELDEVMSTPTAELIEYMKHLDGDIIILGIAGKIGITLGMAAKRAIDRAGIKKAVIGVSRFRVAGSLEKLEQSGIKTIVCDLAVPEQVSELPVVKNVVFMTGKKFGTTDAEGSTWVMNTIVPGNVARYFRESRIVAFSTGCVYDLVQVRSGGSVESDPLTPQGEYANSTVGRERVFLYYSEKNKTPVCLLRLNYAIDLRYGVLREIGEKVMKEEPIDLYAGHVNVIWQGDVINQTLLAFACCEVPARPINITGPETIPIEYAANHFGKLFGKKVRFTGAPSDTALLSNAGEAAGIFGYPRVPLITMIQWTARWLKIGGASLNKPTHFEVRNGKY